MKILAVIFRDILTIIPVNICYYYYYHYYYYYYYYLFIYFYYYCYEVSCHVCNCQVTKVLR